MHIEMKKISRKYLKLKFLVCGCYLHGIDGWMKC